MTFTANIDGGGKNSEKKTCGKPMSAEFACSKEKAKACV